ncbi:sensor histidine kinase [Actinomadura opuntiae]|uniref:sensor histidine kinase n=1 Tax=Actinomadura sp. OS1-43 TaxID=604315 RepID=UPI00255ADBED|nr:histidine kinase [Actinomadura sp. OS1-43]MDL4817873.1 histidine kinase [Actinomadura sp. OS1-43]
MSDTGTGLDRIHSVGGCLMRAAYGGFAFLYLLGGLIAVHHEPPQLWLILFAAVANAAALAPRRWLVRAAVAAGALSLAGTAGICAAADLHNSNPGVFAEIGGLLIVIARTVWKAARDRIVPLTVLLGAAVLAIPLRWSPVGALLFTAPLGITVAVALGVGLYLRAVDARRARSLAAARRDERLELARDLHDFVAHHVTGIVVQAQAARFAAQSGAAQSPEQLDTMFGGIEKAGTEALTSMRQMVGLLRDAQHTAAPDGEAFGGGGARAGEAATRPVGDLTRLRDLVAGFAHPPATLALAPDVGALPPEVAASVHRVVQEALTNVRKHAADAASVHVEVARVGGGSVEVSVRDDGQGRGRRLPSSGFGLAGLTERVDALGGRLHAGPRPEGGWEVVARLPARDT